MNQPLAVDTAPPMNIDLDALPWMHLAGGPEFDYAIDYAYSVLDAEPAAGRIRVVIRWAPGAYCHYHRHLGTTLATLLEGEQHLHEERAFETVHKVRRRGFRGPVTDGDVHMEHAGDEGMTILFDIESADGRLFDLLDRAGNTLLTVSIDDLVQRRLGVSKG